MAAVLESGESRLIMATSSLRKLYCSRHVINPQGLPPAQRRLRSPKRCLEKAACPCRLRPGRGSGRPRPTGSCSTGRPPPGSTASSPGGESPSHQRKQPWAVGADGPSRSIDESWELPGRSLGRLSWARSLEGLQPTGSVPKPLVLTPSPPPTVSQGLCLSSLCSSFSLPAQPLPPAFLSFPSPTSFGSLLWFSP